MFKRLGVKHSGETNVSATLKRTIKGGSNYYGPSIPSEETSAFTKRIKNEETSMICFFFYFYRSLAEKKIYFMI